MDKKKLVLLICALVVAVGTAMVARSMFAGSAAPQAQAATVIPAEKSGPRILVAQRAMPAGTIINADALQYQEWPDELMQDAYYIDGETDMEALLGTVVRFPITAGQPVTKGALVAPGDRGFLAAALGPGMRAVTVPVSDQTGVAGFIFPGDRVDLMLTQTVTGEGDSLKATETILRNVRVLATDQSTVQQKNEQGETVVNVSRTVTLEVTPRIAEKVAVAQSIGTISMSLRSLSDSSGNLEEALASGKVRIPPNATPEQEEAILRQIASRPIDTRTTVSTGGDVSRYQRRTPPPKKTDRNTDGYTPRAEMAPGGAAQPTGPVVRVSRGKQVEAVPVK